MHFIISRSDNVVGSCFASWIHGFESQLVFPQAFDFEAKGKDSELGEEDESDPVKKNR